MLLLLLSRGSAADNQSGFHLQQHDHHAVALVKRSRDTRHLLQQEHQTTVLGALQMSLDCWPGVRDRLIERVKRKNWPPSKMPRIC